MINTVLGQIDKNDLGKTLIHEHIFCGSNDMLKSFGNRWFNRNELVEAAVKQLTYAKEKYGLCTMVDGTPNNLGRDIGILSEVSERSGVNIIVSSGMYYSEEAFLNEKSAESFARYFINECIYGIENTYENANPILPGILKCATGISGFTKNNVMLLKTMAIVQKETGLSMFVHSEHSLKTAISQLRILERAGADLRRVIVGHASDTTDIAYLEELLNWGVYLGFDRIYLQKQQVKTICTLIERGWINKLLLSRDGYIFIDFADNSWEEIKKQGFNESTNPYIVVINHFITMLKHIGITNKEIDIMMINNPMNILGG